MTPPDFDTVTARQACAQLQQVYQDCGFPAHNVSMTVNGTNTEALLFIAWRYNGPVIDGKRFKIFYAPTFREVYVKATKWLSENVQLAKECAR